MDDLTPQEIVRELDRNIVGQKNAKKAVAIALRNRWRRQQLDPDIREEVIPKNILMIGATGVGKTEISRRLAKLSKAPFLKVEATKFTEIGYVGRDVEQIARDLLEIGISMTRKAKRQEIELSAKENVTSRILDSLVGERASKDVRKDFTKRLEKGELDDKEIEIEVNQPHKFPAFDFSGTPGLHFDMIDLGDLFNKSMPGKKKKRKVKIADCYSVLIQEESDKLLDDDQIAQEAIKLVENRGIVFLDEIDKICNQKASGGNISREGVQRDLLPIIEGTIVSTKYGTLKTDHILFIGSGAFHVSKPSDLLPELQGRLPIRVELDSLDKDDFVSILVDTEASLIKQYVCLMATEGVELVFKKSAISRIAELAADANATVENIGARRLHTVLEQVLDDISFNAVSHKGKKVVVDAKYINNHIGDITGHEDLSRYII